MTTWATTELARIAAADELEIQPRRADGTLRRPTPIWVVRDGDNLYVRSYRSAEGTWYRATQTHHEGHIHSGGIDKDVSFVDETDPAVNARIDTAYRTKYQRYGDTYINPMVAPDARATTLKLIPR